MPKSESPTVGPLNLAVVRGEVSSEPDVRVLPSEAVLVQLQVTNNGTAAGTTTCRISDPTLQGSGKPVFVLSPRIAPKSTVTFEQQLTGLTGPARPLAVDCSAP